MRKTTHILSVVAFSSLFLASANAVEVTSVTVQNAATGGQRIFEGQTVKVLATVEFSASPPTPTIPLTPLITLHESVTAEITTPFLLSAVPDVVTSIPLSFDATTGRFEGSFQFLPFNQYTLTVTGRNSIRDCTHIPCTFTTTQGSKSSSFQVLPVKECFLFKKSKHDLTGLEGWSVVNGIFNGDHRAPNLLRGILSPAWDDIRGFPFPPGSIDHDGALELPLGENLFPILTGGIDTAQFTTGLWRIDLISPDLTSNPSFQHPTGLTFRIFAQPSGGEGQVSPIFVEAAFFGRMESDGPAEIFSQESPPVLLSIPAASTPPGSNSPGLAYGVGVASIVVPANKRVKGILIRVFGNILDAGNAQPTIFLDGVCPTH